MNRRLARRLTLLTVAGAIVAGSAAAANAITLPLPLPGGQQETCVVLVGDGNATIDRLCVDY